MSLISLKFIVSSTTYISSLIHGWNVNLQSVEHNLTELPHIDSALLIWEAWLIPRYTPLPTWNYHVKFCSSATKGVCINRKEPPKLGSVNETPPLQWGVADPYKYAPPRAEFGHSRSNGMSVIKEICLKNLTPRVSPFKVTQGHRN